MSRLFLCPTSMELHALKPESSLEVKDSRFIHYQSGTDHWAACGIGPAASALSTALLIEQTKPTRVYLLGIGGAFQGVTTETGDPLKLCDTVQASSDCFADLGYEDHRGFHVLEDMNLNMLESPTPLPSRFSLHTLPDIPAFPFITVSRVTSDSNRAAALHRHFNAAVENMEGAAVAAACALAEVPMTQIRGISNWVGPRDAKSWLIKESLTALGDLLRSRDWFR